jgi:hypothetical protein
VDTPHLASFVKYGKRLMIGLHHKLGIGSLYDPNALYDPEDYFYGGTGGDGGGTIRIVRGGGTPGSQARSYKAGLINWRI